MATEDEVFASLAGDPTDLRGMLAYARYQQLRREWATEYRRQNGRDPTPTAWSNFDNFYTSESLGRLRNEAEWSMLVFGEELVKSATPGILKEALKGSLLHDIKASIIGTFVYSVLIILAAGIFAKLGVDLLSAVQGFTTPNRP
jgi:hypothetical protein